MSHAAEFAEFYGAVHGCPPFRWLAALAEQVIRDGRWPATLGGPAACGKTSVLDVAIFALAKTWHQVPRAQATRVFVTLDGSPLYDRTLGHAQCLAAALAGAGAREDALGTVARELSALSGTSTPLCVTGLFGNRPQIESWADNPRQPAIVVTDDDALGSRLLFRGTGACPSRWPLLAGMAGMDSHIFLDGARPGRAFVETLGWIQRTQAQAAQSPARGLTFTVLSSHPADDPQAWERLCRHSQPELEGRVRAAKPTTLCRVDENRWLDDFHQSVSGFIADGRRLVGCFFNTLDHARAAFQELRQQWGAKLRLALITGRTRPHDADHWNATLLNPIRSGETYRAGPTLLVGTQAMEGADLSFEALITQMAPIPVLVRRFARLNRCGKPGSSPAIILDFQAADPVYGDLRETADFLHRQQPLDFAAGQVMTWNPLPPCPAAELTPLLAPHAELFAYTSPPPQAHPEPHGYIHGQCPPRPEIQLCWRRELSELAREYWPELARQTPPVAGELLALPLVTFQAWCSHLPDAALSDLPTCASTEPRSDLPAPRGQVLRYRPARAADEPAGEVVSPDALQPGDLVMLPTRRGGCDRFGWSPDASPAEDVYEACSRTAAEPVGGADTYRVRTDKRDIPPARWAELLDQPDPRHLDSRLVRDLWPDADAGWLSAELYPAGAPVGLLRTYPSSINPPPRPPRRPPVELRAHLAAVADATRELSEPCLPNPVHRALLHAAGLSHDLGLADPRTQHDFRDRSSVAFSPDDLLAKPLDDAALLAKESPEGFRHELLSLKLYLQSAGSELATDPVAYLIGTHHGYGRPLFPEPYAETVSFMLNRIPTDSGVSAVQRAEAGWFDLIERMHQSFGLWGTAYLEAVFRAAERLASERGAGQRPTPPESALPYRPVPAKARPAGHALRIPGLQAFHPAQYFAALGLAWRCSQLPGWAGIQLSWLKEPGYAACLWTPAPTPLEAVADLVARQQPEWLNQPVLWFEETPGITSQTLPTSVVRALAAELGPREQTYLAAYLHQRQGGFIKHPLLQVCGRLHFEVAFQKNATLLRHELLLRTLLGEGALHPDSYSFGLCPDTWWPNYVAPDSIKVKGGVPWLMQLAIDGFYFLTAAQDNITLFRHHRLVYPVWKAPLSPAAITRLLQIAPQLEADDLHCRYESLQQQLTKALHFLGWPREVTGRPSARTTTLEKPVGNTCAR